MTCCEDKVFSHQKPSTSNQPFWTLDQKKCHVGVGIWPGFSASNDLPCKEASGLTCTLGSLVTVPGRQLWKGWIWGEGVTQRSFAGHQAQGEDAKAPRLKGGSSPFQTLVCSFSKWRTMFVPHEADWLLRQGAFPKRELSLFPGTSFFREHPMASSLPSQIMGLDMDC